jgi:hypothetical protein
MAAKDVMIAAKVRAATAETISACVQHSYAAELLDSGDGRSVGYLLKDRVGDVEEFIDALRRVAAGGTVVDPQVISQLVRVIGAFFRCEDSDELPASYNAVFSGEAVWTFRTAECLRQR